MSDIDDATQPCPMIIILGFYDIDGLRKIVTFIPSSGARRVGMPRGRSLTQLTKSNIINLYRELGIPYKDLNKKQDLDHLWKILDKRGLIWPEAEILSIFPSRTPVNI